MPLMDNPVASHFSNESHNLHVFLHKCVHLVNKSILASATIWSLERVLQVNQFNYPNFNIFLKIYMWEFFIVIDVKIALCSLQFHQLY